MYCFVLFIYICQLYCQYNLICKYMQHRFIVLANFKKSCNWQYSICELICKSCMSIIKKTKNYSRQKLSYQMLDIHFIVCEILKLFVKYLWRDFEFLKHCKGRFFSGYIQIWEYFATEQHRIKIPYKVKTKIC